MTIAGGILTSLLCSLWQRKSQRPPPYAWLLVIGTMAGGALLVGKALERTRLQNAAGLGSSGRTAAWSFLWDQFARHPLRGNGVGSSYVLTQNSDNLLVQRAFLAPHNTYLQLLVDFGAVWGMIFIVMLLSVLAKLAWSRVPGIRPITVPLAVGLAVFAFFDNLLAVLQPAVLTALFTAMLWNGPVASGESAPPGIRMPNRSTMRHDRSARAPRFF
jgi:O-antigen ligase